MEIHQSDCKPCAYCRAKTATMNRRKVAARLARKAYLETLFKAIETGKVIRLYWRDEVTGYHYREDGRGNFIYGGRS